MCLNQHEEQLLWPQPIVNAWKYSFMIRIDVFWGELRLQKSSTFLRFQITLVDYLNPQNNLFNFITAQYTWTCFEIPVSTRSKPSTSLLHQMRKGIVHWVTTWRDEGALRNRHPRIQWSLVRMTLGRASARHGTVSSLSWKFVFSSHLNCRIVETLRNKKMKSVRVLVLVMKE